MQRPASKYTKRDVPVDLLRTLIAYDPVSGAFTWNERPLSVFRTTAAGSGWNKKHALRPAFVNCDRNGYLRAAIFGAYFYAHRVAFALHYGRWPTVIDHINGDRTDNRIVNLREVSLSQNSRNSRLNVNNKSGHMGVRFRKGRWCAYISSGGKQVALGTFKAYEDAVTARKMAERARGFHPNHGRAA